MEFKNIAKLYDFVDREAKKRVEKIFYQPESDNITLVFQTGWSI